MKLSKILNNAQKVTYLVSKYPKHTLVEIIGMLAMPQLDINIAIWHATNSGWIAEPNKTEGTISLLQTPSIWRFNEEIGELKEQLVYAFTELGKKKNDLLEEELFEWCHGYPSHDQFIALNMLLDEKKLGTYKLTDPNDLDSTYTFYTLYEHVSEAWGKARFKVQPTGEEVPNELVEGEE